MHFVSCVLFDKNRLCKGLALIRSLRADFLEFTLWVLCMDGLAYSILQKMRLENVRLITLDSIERLKIHK